MVQDTYNYTCNGTLIGIIPYVIYRMV